MASRFVFRPLPVMTVATVLSLAILIALGVWQLQRLEWKTALIASLEARTAEAPVPLASLAPAEIDALEYRRVTVEGTFDHGAEMQLFGHVSATRDSLAQVGVFLVTPLVRDGAPPVLVNRGFVPQALKDPLTRPGSQPSGPVTVTGAIRLAEVPGAFTPENTPAANTWYWRDHAAMAAQAGRPEALAILIEAEAETAAQGDPDRPWPLPGRAQPRIVNNHLGYAVTWFSLALGLVVIYGVFHASQGRLRIGL